MTQPDRVSPRQFVAAAFVSTLSPLVRRFPGALAARAGRGAWLAVPLSALPLLIALAAAQLLFRKRPAGGDLADVFTDVLGAAPGRILTGLYSLWFAFYAAFVLRSGAERFLTTVYTGAGPGVFVVVTALLCCLAAAGRLLPLARAAMIIRPLLLGLILAVALLTAKDLDLSLLLPLSSYDLREASAGALEVANMLSVGFFLGFFGGQLTRPLRVRDYAPWLGALLTVVALMTVGCLGMFGPELTACLSYPYFMLVRDLTVLGALERVEPVVIALWVFSDFLLISLLLRLSAQTLRFSLGLPADGRQQAVLPLLCTLAAAAAALALPGTLSDFRFLSETVVPLLSALFGFGPLPLLLLIAALRKKL